MRKKKLLLVGAGKIGNAIVDLLRACRDYTLTVVDKNIEVLGHLSGTDISTQEIDVSDASQLQRVASGHDAILSAMPYAMTPLVANVASRIGAHYFDLTEDVGATRAIKSLAENASSAFVPQCGLAPGFISIVANDLARRFDKLRSIEMRVGALPVYPTNALKYNLTWSTDGLINEYCNPCESIRAGILTEVPALEELERFSLDGVEYEAFNTSGGLGTLCESLAGQLDSLNYKTVRYPGHRDVVRMLVRDLQLGSRRDIFKDVLENAIPMTHQDVVLIFVTATGWQQGRLTQESYAKKIYNKEVNGKPMSAIQLTTAAGICCMTDLLFQEKLPQRGFVRQEQASFEDFMSNRFGKYFS